MSKLKNYWLIGSALALVATSAYGRTFAIAPGDLDLALNVYQTQSGLVLAVADDAMHGIRTAGVRGELSDDQALIHLLKGTGFTYARDQSGVIAIVPQERRPVRLEKTTPVRVAATASSGIESVVVTSSKIKGDIQTVPIAITALSQEQLTSRQIAGGPDLVKEVPNLTFTKTNFTGYSIQIRGIGTQAISVTTDPAVAIAFNDIPFIRNHFFEQEFYDVNQVEVLRGPQGTLYGRNATAGVVNVISAKPTDQFEAMVSADIGNYHNRRFEGMVNIPIVDDRADLRIAGEWTKRDGYSFNQLTDQPIDGRDLWSGRVTLGFKPSKNLQTTLVWEHFQENDDRMRTAKQTCKTAPIPDTVGGVPTGAAEAGTTDSPQDFLSQGCLPTSLYSADAFQVPNGYSLAYYSGLSEAVSWERPAFDVYASTLQSRNLRVIESSINPIYKAKNDTIELNMDYLISSALTFTSQTGYSHDLLWSTEDYNRFNSAPGAFEYSPGEGAEQHGVLVQDPSGLGICRSDVPDSCGGAAFNAACDASTNGCSPNAMFCDPQLGCSDRLVAQDLSEEHAWQLSQEFRLTSNFSGPFNFSIGGNYLHYETEENYYVFINTLSLFAMGPLSPATDGKDGSNCLTGGFRTPNPLVPRFVLACKFVDLNPLTSLNNQGHNYFLSQNPYTLNSYAGFGEAYYNLTSDLKLVGGLRWTQDEKHFIEIPSEVVVPGYGYNVAGVVNQKWAKLTGRATANWTPKLDFTDQTLIYGSYAHGYKAGGANPPGAIFPSAPVAGADFVAIDPIHPLTFKPEFVDAYELGSKNTLLDGAITLNGNIFFYNYKNYQISRIVDRTAINDNFNARVHGAELETAWEPAPGLKLNFAGGYESTTLDKGEHSIDLMDRTAGNPDWIVVKPTITVASNCILPVYLVAALFEAVSREVPGACSDAYFGHLDPVTGLPYTPNPSIVANSRVNGIPSGYPGFDPLSVDPNAPPNVNNGTGLPPNNGEGFDKDLSGNQLPNAPHFTASLSAEYTMPVSENWAATLHSDFYWQSQSWARVFNDRPYDKLRGYSSTNLALILTSADGWQVLGYLKNVFNKTAITGDFLNSDDSGLTTNIFLTDPRLFGVRVTKNW